MRVACRLLLLCLKLQGTVYYANKKNLVIMYALACLHGMVFYGPVAVLYRQAAGVSVFQTALIESISLVLTVPLELPPGELLQTESGTGAH